MPSGNSLRVLAIDTTAADCSVSFRVEQDGAVKQCTERQALTAGQSRAVLEQVQAVREQGRSWGVQPRSTRGQESGAEQALVKPDLIAFGAGPGAFTGLRVACGVAQGLAFGWDCPVVGVDSLTTLAWQAWRAWQAEPREGMSRPRIAVALDVRMQELAFAVYEPTGAPWIAGQSVLKWPTPLADPILCSPEQAVAMIEAQTLAASPMILAGDAFKVYPALHRWQLATSAEQPDATAVAELGALGFRMGRAIDPAQAAPFYLRDKVALDRHEQERARFERRQKGV
ncbi:MAG: tRNA (adenosine(37)-N6)-threonylcarbamoyltransferase complex dimerization subunit type 1 TsaB [Burkholderiaceae bacterium]